MNEWDQQDVEEFPAKRDHQIFFLTLSSTNTFAARRRNNSIHSPEQSERTTSLIVSVFLQLLNLLILQPQKGQLSLKIRNAAAYCAAQFQCWPIQRQDQQLSLLLTFKEEKL